MFRPISAYRRKSAAKGFVLIGAQDDDLTGPPIHPGGPVDLVSISSSSVRI
jgi:hypothetical protein